MIGHVIIWVLFFFLLWACIKAEKRGGGLYLLTFMGFFISIIGVVISIYALVAKLFLFLIGY